MKHSVELLYVLTYSSLINAAAMSASLFKAP